MTSPGPGAICSGCGMALAWRPGLGDIWTWCDEQGRTTVGGAEGVAITGNPDPVDEIRRTLALIDELRAARLKRPPAERQVITPEEDAADRYYADLLIRFRYGFERPHVHRHDPPPPVDVGPVPECCDWPMRLRPSGWSCRINSEHSPCSPARGLS